MVVKELVNLNKDSTHPNPWAPRTVWEQHTNFWQPYKIYRGNPTDVKPLYNPLAQDPLISKIGVVGWKGFLLGTGLAFSDIIVISQVKGLRAVAARYFFLMPPYMAMPISYVVTRDAAESVFGDKPWVYFWSTAAPAAIWGAFRNSLGYGFAFFAFTAWMPYIYKMNIDTGGYLHSSEPTIKKDSVLPLTWKIDFPYAPFQKWNHGPSWKQWVDPEKTGPGPEI